MAALICLSSKPSLYAVSRVARCFTSAPTSQATSSSSSSPLFGFSINTLSAGRKVPELRNVQWVFLGCPGVGKGTYASRLSALLGVPHIATGDLVREELSSSGPLSHQNKRGEIADIGLGALDAHIGNGFLLQGEDMGEGAHTPVPRPYRATLHAFGRVLILDCAPCGTEGAFVAWHSWVVGIGACASFAVASTIPGKISTSFGAAFVGAAVGATVLIYGNVSDYGGF